MTMWIAVIAACLVAFVLKLLGYLVPERVQQIPWLARIIPLLPVALLTSLVVTQAFVTSSGGLTLDARAAGVTVAVIAVLLRAPFLLVVALAAVTAALVRMWTG